MSTADIAEDAQTTEKAFDNPTDEIADLLLGEEETAESDESEDEETLSDESTDDDEVAESEEAEEESDEDESDATWGNALGVPEEALAFDDEGNITGVNVKVNGKMDTVSMADLIRDHQGSKSVTEKSQSLATERKAFDEAKIVVEQEYASKLENVETITDYLSKKLVSEFEGVNWDQLRVENPAEYAAARQDYSARAQELKQAQDAVMQEKEAANSAKSVKMQERNSAYLTAQYNKMIENNPTWTDKTVLKESMTNLEGFASDQYGFTAQDFNAVSDARLIEVLKDAKSYNEGVKIATAKRKKPVPKFQKSKGTTKKVSKLSKLTKSAKLAKGANKRRLQTDAIVELLGG